MRVTLLLAGCAGSPVVHAPPAAATEPGEPVDLSETGCLATLVVYDDADGDGFGNAATEAFACEVGEGQSDVSGDCDDANGNAWPGAIEGCGPVDLDCDGVEAGVCVLAFEDGDATITDGIALVHDVTGDGLDDAVGVGTLGGEKWRLWVVPGPVSGGRTVTEADAVASIADVGFYGLPGEYADAADVTGDGFGDLWVASADLLDITLYPGPWSGTPAPLTTWKGVRSVTMTDMTGDGQVDVWAADLVEERVYLLAGPVDAATTLTEAVLVVDDAHQGGYSSDAFGGLLLDMGDHDADGVADLVAMDVNYEMFVDWEAPTGDLRIYGADQRGEISSDDAQVLWSSRKDNFHARGVVPAGDVDSDGFDDLLVAMCDTSTVGAYATGCLLSGPLAPSGPDWAAATTYWVSHDSNYSGTGGAGAVLPTGSDLSGAFVAWATSSQLDPEDFYSPKERTVHVLPAEADRGAHDVPEEGWLRLETTAIISPMNIPSDDGLKLWMPEGSCGLHDVDGSGASDLASGGLGGLVTHGQVLGLDTI